MKFKIRKINEKGEHGAWKEMVTDDSSLKNKNMISGYYLISHGWIQSKNSYKKGDDIIFYSGTDWFLNGKIITTINEIP